MSNSGKYENPLDRLEMAEIGLAAVESLVGAIHTSGEDLHCVHTQGLCYLIGLLRSEIEGSTAELRKTERACTR